MRITVGVRLLRRVFDRCDVAQAETGLDRAAFCLKKKARYVARVSHVVFWGVSA